MENYISSNHWSLDTHDVSNVLQDYETVWQIFPEKSCVEVQLYILLASWNISQILSFNWHHWEWYSRVPDVGVEDCLEVGWISNLTLVHGANSLCHWHALVQINIWEFCNDGLFQSLNFIIESLNFISTLLIKTFIQEWHVFLLEDGGALIWLIFKETCHSSWMNDLIAWAQSQIQERWNWNAWQEEALAESIADVMQIRDWISGSIECSLWSNNVDIFSVSNSFANEWHILKTENGKFFLLNQIFTKDEFGLHIEGALSEDCANESSFLDVLLNLFKNFVFGVCW